MSLTPALGFPGPKLYASLLFRQGLAGMSHDLGRDQKTKTLGDVSLPELISK